MRFADFILANIEPMLIEWEKFARSIGAGEKLDKLALRDHAEQILHATARDMKSPQTAAQRAEKSKGDGHLNTGSDALDGASDLHAIDRLGLGFDMLEVMSEYRALRASVLQLWRDSTPLADAQSVDDVTRFNESIDQSLAKAVASYTRRVDQARDMFLAILSHDLRNPLSAIAMSAQSLPLLGEDEAKRVECGLRIGRSVSVMQRMISDLLDYTRTRLGAGMPVQPSPMDLAALARELTDEFRMANPGREIRFDVTGDLNGRWDPGRIRQAISNLLGNAVQHGASDAPVVLSLRRKDETVFVSVHNSGVPIPAGELPRIFDPLVRGSSAQEPRDNRPGSIGMGLYIAREVAKSHGGVIDVLSSAEQGTTFTMTLPRTAAPKEGQPILNADDIRKM